MQPLMPKLKCLPMPTTQLTQLMRLTLMLLQQRKLRRRPKHLVRLEPEAILLLKACPYLIGGGGSFLE